MKSIFAASIAIACVLAGCAAPGSALTRVSVSGRAKPNTTIDLLLPGSYGLAGLDAAWGQPSDYGHHDRVVTVRTDSTGHFEHLFPPTTYSIAFFLLPPLGAIPRQPPPPLLAFRTPDVRPDCYVVGSTRGRFDCRIQDHTTGTLRPDPTHRVSGSFELRDFPLHDSRPTNIRGWQANLNITAP